MRMIAILACAILLLTGCHPMRLPILKEEARRQDERITRETDEAIKKSPKLQELNQLCTEKIPRPSGFELVKKARDYHEETWVDYGYRSALELPKRPRSNFTKTRIASQSMIRSGEEKSTS